MTNKWFARIKLYTMISLRHDATLKFRICGVLPRCVDDGFFMNRQGLFIVMITPH